ncbi:Non-specific ribonucleoside hydrolase RihC [Mixta intestinalis]|uniref:Non-specific ribonucleoside hydrolase RihC n=1 Tax=Mixta intestinalis TaxID=1615494 RepID=A0A6P1Q5K8_9GAMM|nr:Non-specific ribonucleoside hydrolase RihC [Mixta intestinalis]
MHDIILDTDIGVDDAFALAYAANTQRLLGITTVFGNVAVEQAVKNARLFCHKTEIGPLTDISPALSTRRRKSEYAGKNIFKPSGRFGPTV